MDFVNILCTIFVASLWFSTPFSLHALEPAIRESESTCVSCHRDLEGMLSEPVRLWEKSIHHDMGNGCEGCHGGDKNDPAEAMSPQKGFVGVPSTDKIVDFCGKCHVGVSENFKKSVHFQASQTNLLQKKNTPTCVTCHRSHDIHKASLDLINESLCSTCHSFENPKRIKEAFASTELSLEHRKEDLNYLERRGMSVKKLKEKHFALRNTLHQLTHTFDVPEIQNKTHSVNEALQTTGNDLKVLHRNIHRRWWVGLGVACFLVIFIVVLVKLLKTYEDDAS
ncbi:MAG: cytochrome c3 family protein [Deltaproteobacteria bacterium]|nr:cytochrome c3 family protein [Deltaproteobacteria bacterium]